MINPYVYPGITIQATDKSVVEMVIHRLNKFSEENICEHTRRRSVVEARQIAMFIIKRFTGLSLSAIGAVFGRDHATVLHAIKIVKELKENKEYRNRYSTVFESFNIDMDEI